MNLIFRECPLCRSNSWKPIAEKTQYVREFKSHGPEVVYCNNCSLIYLNPVMDNESYRDFYSKDMQKKIAEMYIAEDYSKKTHDQSIYRKKILRDYLSKDTNILDVGCGYGDFLYSIKDEVATANGIEPSLQRAKYGKSHGLNIIHGSITDWPDSQQVDIITMFQVIEHVVDIHSFMKKAISTIRPNGRIVIEVPNHDDILVKSKRYRWFYYQNGHCTYFTMSTLQKLLKFWDLEVEADIPIQRYSFSNHIHWILKAKPGQFKTPILFDDIYAAILRKTRLSDTIFLILRRSKIK
jgi:2-polyprenyl-3-methyl-5-hydroxy-6-metoxy-1,4-benzoquinol methylase